MLPVSSKILNERKHNQYYGLSSLDQNAIALIARFLSTEETEMLYLSSQQLFSESLWRRIVFDQNLHYFDLTSPCVEIGEAKRQYLINCPNDYISEQTSFSSLDYVDGESLRKNWVIQYIVEQDIEKVFFQQTRRSWRSIFTEYRKKIVYSGTYQGLYGSHGLEALTAYQFGYFVFFVKKTGDQNVPAKKVSFYMHLSVCLQIGIGKVMLADPGYLNPRWGCSTVKVFNQITKHSQLLVDWYIQENEDLSDLLSTRVRFAVWKHPLEFKPTWEIRRAIRAPWSEEVD